jgi:hypothetical protein
MADRTTADNPHQTGRLAVITGTTGVTAVVGR